MDITLEDIQKTSKIHGPRNAMRIMESLGKKEPFMSAMKNEVMQEIAKEVIVELEMLLNKIIDNKITDEEKMRYKVLNDILGTWSEKIAGYYKLVGKIKGG